jgi:hypothetical protein
LPSSSATADGYAVVEHRERDGRGGRRWRTRSDDLSPRVSVTTGGTGFTARDETPEGTGDILDREAPDSLEACGPWSPSAGCPLIPLAPADVGANTPGSPTERSNASRRPRRPACPDCSSEPNAPLSSSPSSAALPPAPARRRSTIGARISGAHCAAPRDTPDRSFRLRALPARPVGVYTPSRKERHNRTNATPSRGMGVSPDRR